MGKYLLYTIISTSGCIKMLFYKGNQFNISKTCNNILVFIQILLISNTICQIQLYKISLSLNVPKKKNIKTQICTFFFISLTVKIQNSTQHYFFSSLFVFIV